MEVVFLKQLSKRAELLEKTITKLKADLEAAPEGRLRISRNGDKLQYYHFIPEKTIRYKGCPVSLSSIRLPGLIKSVKRPGRRTTRSRRYISKKDTALIRALALADYERRALKLAERELHHISRLLNFYRKEGTMEGLSDSMDKGRLDLIPKRWLTDDEYVEQWLSQDFVPKGFSENDPMHFTSKGERVRSKSEVILASRYTARTVPYIYELPLVVNGEVFHPDFTLLNVRTREVFIWEHLGKMDEPGYIRDAADRLIEYKKAGYYVGVNLIITYETAKQPLNEKEIDALIDRFLK